VRSLEVGRLLAANSLGRDERAGRIFNGEGEPMRRILFSVLALLSLSSCFVHTYRDDQGHAYRHERWHGEEVYRREDGRWYARHDNQWILRSDVSIQ